MKIEHFFVQCEYSIKSMISFCLNGSDQSARLSNLHKGNDEFINTKRNLSKDTIKQTSATKSNRKIGIGFIYKKIPFKLKQRIFKKQHETI